MIAALAANSDVGASGRGLFDRSVGFGVEDLEGGSTPRLSPAADDFSVGLLAAPNGMTLTGIMMTFLNEVMKSFLAAVLLTLDMKKETADASSSRRRRSQASTWAVAVFLK